MSSFPPLFGPLPLVTIRVALSLAPRSSTNGGADHSSKPFGTRLLAVDPAQYNHATGVRARRRLERHPAHVRKAREDSRLRILSSMVTRLIASHRPPDLAAQVTGDRQDPAR